MCLHLSFSVFSQHAQQVIAHIRPVSEPKHVAYVRAFGKLLDDLRAYIMQWHTTGLAWNSNVCLLCS